MTHELTHIIIGITAHVLTTVSSHAMDGLNVTTEPMEVNNPDGNIGKDVWGLATDHVVYVSKSRYRLNRAILSPTMRR